MKPGIPVNALLPLKGLTSQIKFMLETLEPLTLSATEAKNGFFSINVTAYSNNEGYALWDSSGTGT